MEARWGVGVTSLSNKPEEISSSKEREARSIALEKAYVHDVYSQIASHFSDSRYRFPRPKVKQFLLDLEPGSTLCDVGCGNGKYLDINPSICKIGIDRCSSLTGAAKEKNHEVLVSDNLNIPFRDDCFDAVISIAVIHHFATTERRVAALQELARVLRIGGRLMVSVWAMEQRHRRFESQDVLVPWSRPMTSSSEDKTSSVERDLNSTTTTTSDDDAATHYHAYTQTSDSDHSYSCSLGGRKRGRIKHRGRSIDPTCPSSSQSSSDLSSPNESCYTFVRRALQKLAGTRRNRGGKRPWFLQGLEIPMDEDGHFGSLEEDAMEGLELRAGQNLDNLVPIELRQLESTEFSELLQLQEKAGSLEGGKFRGKPAGVLFSNVLHQRRRRTLETASDILGQGPVSIEGQPKSKSLSDLLNLLPVGLLRPIRKSSEELKNQRVTLHQQCSTSSLSVSSREDVHFPGTVSHKLVQTEIPESPEEEEAEETEDLPDRKLRPTLVKQKQSICSPTASEELVNISVTESDRGNNLTAESGKGTSLTWGDIKREVQALPQVGSSGSHLQVPTSGKGLPSSFWKQSSLNEDLIFTERLKEKELLKQNIQKQASLNEDLMWKRRETRWDQMKEAFLNSPNVKCLQILRDGITQRFRGEGERAGSMGSSPKRSPEPPSSSSSSVASSLSPNSSGQNAYTNQPPPSASTSIRNGIVRMLQTWKQGDQPAGSHPNNVGSAQGTRRGSKESGGTHRLFPPFFLRRSSAGSLNTKEASSKVLSPPPHMNRRPSEADLLPEGNKLLPGVRQLRKLSREEGSDSSKDSSFQSDTSVDSEDSFASVIFIPNKGALEGDAFTFNPETRANSLESPKSPASRFSPPNHMPKSPSPLASELLRRRSPEVSPTKGTCGKEVPRFLFDENSTKLLSPPYPRASPGPDEEADTAELESLTLAVPPQKPPESPPSPPKEEPPIVEVVEVEAPVEPNPEPQPTPEPLPPVPVKKKKSDKIEVLRKPAVLPEGNRVTRQLVRRSLPKSLAVELFNPETDDADTSDTSSSSPDSVSSVVSVINEEEVPADKKAPQQEDSPLIPESASVPENLLQTDGVDQGVKKEPSLPSTEQEPHSEKDTASSSSLENLLTKPDSSSPLGRRKLTLAKLGSTSDWLSSLPRRPHPSATKGHGKDTKWPSSLVDESPSSHSHPREHEVELPSLVSNAKILEEMEEGDSLYDSLENLSNRGPAPSRNPSIDSSIRMSSTCSCSIRGGESFESWSSAKSSLTNSSSHHHAKPSGPTLPPRPPIPSCSRIRRQGTSSKSSSAAGEDTTDESTALTYHRYYHVFREGELDKLIEKYVQNLHIISSYYDHANWCIVAEKVQVWTI